MISISYDLTKHTRPGAPLSVRTFTVREVDGRDEERAALAAKAKGGAHTVTDELVRLSLTEVDGERVNVDDAHPYAGYDSWNTRTRTLVAKAFYALNSVDPKEEADFLAGGQVTSG